MLKIKFAVSTWLWTSPFSTNTVELFPKIKAMGFDGVEIPVEDPDIIDTKVVLRALNDNGLEPIVCGAFGPTRDLTHDDPKYHQECFDYVQQCFKICNELGAHFLAGPMYSAVGKTRLLPDNERKKEFDLAANNLFKVCEMAEKQDLQIAIEPLNRFESDLINTAEDVIRLVKTINHPAAKILMDSFHMTIEERNLHDAINTVGDKLIHVQVSENHRGVPGTGQTQWKKLKQGLEDIGYEGFVSIESFTPNVEELAGAVCIWRSFAEDQDEFAEKGLSFLKNWAGFT